MWCLWNLGLLAEPLMGSFGCARGLHSHRRGRQSAFHAASTGCWPIHDASGGDMSFPAGAGASGAVFGIAGALIMLLKSQRLPVPPFELKRLRKSVIYFAAINLVLGLSISFGTRLSDPASHIDNMAHMGGFICGLLFAVPMVPRIGSPRQRVSRRACASPSLHGRRAAGAVRVSTWRTFRRRQGLTLAARSQLCAKIFAYAARLIPPQEEDYETPRIPQAGRHHRRSRRLSAASMKHPTQDSRQSHRPPHAGQDRRAALHHRLRRHRGDE